jgi:sporulation protein YlmC with PRC-barrel domain
MKKLIMLLVSILVVALFTGTSFAGEAKTVDSAFTVKQLIGLNVNDLEGNHVGKIRDVNLNTETSEINYLILGKSLLGIGEDKFAVPLEALKIQNAEGSVTATLIVSEIRLISAPTIGVGESDGAFGNRLQNYYCEAPEFDESFISQARC